MLHWRGLSKYEEVRGKVTDSKDLSSAQEALPQKTGGVVESKPPDALAHMIYSLHTLRNLLMYLMSACPIRFLLKCGSFSSYMRRAVTSEQILTDGPATSTCVGLAR